MSQEGISFSIFVTDDIFTPEYIESFEYEEWDKSGGYSEMKSFKIDVDFQAEDVREIVMDYTINGDVDASTGVRNIDFSPFQQGEVSGTVKFGDCEQLTLTGNPTDGYKIS